MKIMHYLLAAISISTSLVAMQEAELKIELAQQIPHLKWNSFTYTKDELRSLQTTLQKFIQADDSLFTTQLKTVDKAINKYLTSVTYHPARSLSPATSNTILAKEIYQPLVYLICELETKTNSPMSALARHVTKLKWNSHNYLKDEINDLSRTIAAVLEQTTNSQTVEELNNISRAIKKYNENLRYTNFTGGISPYRLHEIYEYEIYKPLVCTVCQNIINYEG